MLGYIRTFSERNILYLRRSVAYDNKCVGMLLVVCTYWIFYVFPVWGSTTTKSMKRPQRGVVPKHNNIFN